MARLSDDHYPEVASFDWAGLRDSADRYAEGAVNVLEGVGRGLLLMVVTLVSIGVAIAISKVLMKAPVKAMVGEL